MDHDKQCVLVIIGAERHGQQGHSAWSTVIERARKAGRNCCLRAGAWRSCRRRRRSGTYARFTEAQGAALLGPQDRQRAQSQMPKSLRPKRHLHDIWMAETRADAEAAFDLHRSLRRKIPQGRRAPDQDRSSFYDLPAEHWKHNPTPSKAPRWPEDPSRKTALAMAFKLILSARRKWRKLDGSNQLAEPAKACRSRTESR